MRDEVISDEQINAFIDDELDTEERALILAAIHTDEKLADELNELQKIKEQVMLAFSEPPINQGNRTAPYRKVRSLAMAASVTLLIVTGVTMGWLASSHNYISTPSSNFDEIATFDPGRINNDKILFHVSSMDPAKVDAALIAAEKLLSGEHAANKDFEVEIVANASGLGLLRSGSPYRPQVESLASRYPNVSFKACGIAMETAHLKEGEKVKLLPQAEKVNAALDQILKRIQQGWLYVRA